MQLWKFRLTGVYTKELTMFASKPLNGYTGEWNLVALNRSNSIWHTCKSCIDFQGKCLNTNQTNSFQLQKNLFGYATTPKACGLSPGWFCCPGKLSWGSAVSSRGTLQLFLIHLNFPPLSFSWLIHCSFLWRCFIIFCLH